MNKNQSEIRKAYDIWSENYDTDKNKTRDLEAAALRNMLSGIKFNNCLEIGCGTGKNTDWFLNQSKYVTAIDFSENMLAKAREKIKSGNVIFKKADINGKWDFAGSKYDLISFSLVLEHIENLDEVFRKSSEVSEEGGYLYIGELHPFRQYSGTKARFDNEDGRHILDCFNHNISDFTEAAGNYGFNILKLEELFDEDDRKGIPRILSLLFIKNLPINKIHNY